MGVLKDIQKNISGKARHATYRDRTTPEGHFAIKATWLGSERVFLLEGEEGEPNAPIKGNVVLWKKHGSEELELVAYRGSEILGGERVGTFSGTNYADAFSRILRQD